MAQLGFFGGDSLFKLVYLKELAKELILWGELSLQACLELCWAAQLNLDCSTEPAKGRILWGELPCRLTWPLWGRPV